MIDYDGMSECLSDENVSLRDAASALWDLSGWEAAEPDGVFAGGGNGEGIEISSEVGEDEKFASLEL